MQFSAREEIPAPLSDVWAAVSDAEHFEQLILRKGIEVERCEGAGALHVGMSWKVRFASHGADRVLDAQIVRYAHGESLELDMHASGIDGIFQVRLEPLSEEETCLSATLDTHAQSFAGRILLQTLKLASAALEQRYRDRIHRFACSIVPGS